MVFGVWFHLSRSSNLSPRSFGFSVSWIFCILGLFFLHVFCMFFLGLGVHVFSSYCRNTEIQEVIRNFEFQDKKIQDWVWDFESSYGDGVVC